MPFYFLFVIFFAGLDGARPIELLQEEQAAHLVGKGHGRQGEHQVGLGKQLG